MAHAQRGARRQAGPCFNRVVVLIFRSCSMSEFIQLKRECAAIAIPSGNPSILPEGTVVSVMQFLGSSWTVTSAHGMVRIDVKDADALGLEPPTSAADAAGEPEIGS